MFFFFFSSRRRHTRCGRDWSSDVCSSDLSVPARAAHCSGNVQLALELMTHRPADSLIADWHRALTDAAQPVAVATGVTLPTDRSQREQARLTPAATAGARLLVSPGKEQHYNLAPALSPDGSRR